jgi:soluble lytic murein transglycosylase
MSPLRKAASIKDEEHALIRNLVFVGEKQLLEEYLKAFVTDLRLKKESDAETWLYYLKAYAKADLYLPLFAEIGSLNPEMRSQLLRKYPELLFPRKHLDTVRKWADKLAVAPELILAIMRQESAFDSNARSPADAMGLMQILPSVAKEHEKKVGLEMTHFEDLFTADLNIAVGSAILADLKIKYKDQFVLVAAAYNANDKAIRNWLKTRLFEDPIAFIEDIPYEETRSYIKLVLRNFIFYSRLNSPTQTFDFPNWAFEGLKEYRDIVKND